MLRRYRWSSLQSLQAPVGTQRCRSHSLCKSLRSLYLRCTCQGAELTAALLGSQAHIRGRAGSIHSPLVLVSTGLLPVPGIEAHSPGWVEWGAAGTSYEGTAFAYRPRSPVSPFIACMAAQIGMHDGLRQASRHNDHHCMPCCCMLLPFPAAGLSFPEAAPHMLDLSCMRDGSFGGSSLLSTSACVNFSTLF